MIKLTTTEEQLTDAFGEHCGLNADFLNMTWVVNEDTQIYIFSQETYDYNGDPEYTVLHRGEWDNMALFTGTAQECIDYVIANNLNPIL